MNKRILSLVLALVMVLGTFTSVFAAETDKDEKKPEAPKAGDKVEKIVGKDNKIQYIIDKKFVEGYEDGSFGYDKNIKRSEITRLLVLANGHEELAKKLQGSMKIYKDVDTAHWANGVITVGTTKPSEANGIPFLVGYPDGNFLPENDVTYAELATMLVILVKKDLTKEMYDNAIWASSWMTWAAELGILEDVTIADSNAPATRADAFVMMYNALYRMQSFKKAPVNEKIGVLSSLNKKELVLNQDKDQMYKITDDTVFVNANRPAKYDNVVRVKEITNPDYYLGSLIRIMVNDKNEVSHILELGNPREMALGLPEGSYGDNARWKGVADKTVSTHFHRLATLNLNDADYDKFKDEFESFATINFKDNKTKAKSITFVNVKDMDAKDDNYSREISLNVNSDTKVYVANPYNNIMKEVKDIGEALSLIGYRHYESYRIPNVYAGYDTTELNPVYQPIQTAGYKRTAKVIVFNVVSKDQGGDLFRVVRDSSYNGKLTLEDTDGKLYDRDFFKNMAYFPYNYGDFYDVIEVKYYANNNADAIVEKIDYDDTKAFPIVKVVRIEDNALVIEDEVHNRSILDIRDADIFNAKQFEKLAIGDTLQFRVDEGTNEAEIISILGNVPMKGNISKILPSAQKEQAVGMLNKVTGLENDNNFANVEIDVYYDLFDGDLGKGIHTFVVDKDVARSLLGHEGEKVEFKVQENYGYAGNYKAYDFKINGIFIDKAKVDAYKIAVDKLAKDYGLKGEDIDEENIQIARKALDAAEDLYNDLGLQDRQDVAEPYRDTHDDIERAAKEVEEDIANKEAYKALQAKYEEAKALLDSTEESSETDVTQIPKGKKVATKADRDDFKEKIDAVSWLNNPGKAASLYNESIQELDKLMADFNSKIRTGTKEA